MFQLWQFRDIFACEVVSFYCYILQQENFTFDMNSSEVELWNSFSFTKEKWYHKVLSFGHKYS